MGRTSVREGTAWAAPERPLPVLTDAARPTANLITVVINKDGTASFALPRMEVGQRPPKSPRS